ncbi:hypothetical protein F9C07_5681 [Aspergillus flavus]|uniref:Uncharacterized protein n=1 Tax=Aspergillus flavus (strain ATCC 200026 / FGSC A1120 / IAM 13836 / NRRL 3357 / JCM 12722 / SRRC 167) TaxID=332952 RepID=A0A7U2MXG7_ASPFN|nr:hypothetical protein AFLA_007921 [Aspergillus flavus NRRL3357]KOC11673.1 hypothetical protein AFLA70_26g004780 [Aspergillus flavus AF70]QRD91635.1 hypothetical protein F9C07_5681 [Aspergillus flavus]
MSGTDPIDPNARREVSKAIASSGSAAVGRMIDAANSSVEKRRRNKEARAKREVEKKAAKEGQPPYLVRLAHLSANSLVHKSRIPQVLVLID